MSRTQRKYDHEYKVQAVKLAREIGGAKAAKGLGIPEGTIHTCVFCQALFPKKSVRIPCF